MRRKIIALFMITTMLLVFAPMDVFAASAAVSAPWSVRSAKGYASYNRVHVEWTPVSNADGYRIYWAANGVKGNVLIKGRNAKKWTHYVTDSRLMDRNITYVIYAVKLSGNTID